MNSQQAIIEASLKLRHAKSRRFKRIGRLTLWFSALMLLWLLASIMMPALSGYTRYEVALATPTATTQDTNYYTLLHRLFDDVAPTIEGITAREKYTLLGTFASFDVKAQIGGAVSVPLSDMADQYLKGQGTGSMSERQIALLDALKKEGLVARHLNSDFFTAGDSRAPESAGVLASLVGSLLLVLVAISLSLPIGVMAAVYLEEFAPKHWISDVIEVTINNLAAVPSIIFGLLGLSLYLLLFDLPRSSALVGGLTVALMVLPTIIITTRAALRAVPPSVRLAAAALGASPLQVAAHHVVPYAMGGIMTGTILAVARAIGETAPLLMIGMVAFIADIPRGLLDPATAMPVQIYIWASSPEAGFGEKTASAIVLLLAILMALNALAIYIRNKFEIRW